MPLIDLDEFIGWIDNFTDDLLRESKPYGSFLWKQQILPNLLYLNDLVWLRWLTGKLNSAADKKVEWADTINNFQYPEGGFFHNPPFEKHTWQHATWRSLVSLNMLGGKPRYPLCFLENLKDISTCKDWICSHRSKLTAIAHHRYTLGAFIAASEAPTEWTDAYFSAVQSLQNPETGFWSDKNHIESLSSTFMFSVIHIALGREIHYIRRILDTTLSLRKRSGLFTSSNTLTFHDMDALFLLNYISQNINHRRDESLSAIRRVAVLAAKYWEEGRKRVFLENPHSTLAICGIYSVFKSSLPDEVAGSSMCRFPYAAAEFIRLPSCIDFA